MVCGALTDQPDGIASRPLYGVDAAFMPLQGVLCNLRKRRGWQETGCRTSAGPRAVFVMLAMRRSSHEARAALVPGGITP
jgi:hypothetical protein